VRNLDFGHRPEDIEKMQNSEEWSYVFAEPTANSKKASMLWCGKVPFGGPNITFAKPIETFFELSISSAPPSFGEQNHEPK